MKLDLGAGNRKKQGFTTVDNNILVSPDFLVDLNKVPYPFKDNSIDEINACHVLEHLNEPFTIMKELHRILKPNGKLRIQVPHFSRGMTHSQHSKCFSLAFPLYFDKTYHGGYFGVDFENISSKIRYMVMWDLKTSVMPKWSVPILKMVNNIITFLANINPYITDRFFPFFLGGFEEVEFEFIKK